MAGQYRRYDLVCMSASGGLMNEGHRGCRVALKPFHIPRKQQLYTRSESTLILTYILSRRISVHNIIRYGFAARMSNVRQKRLAALAPERGKTDKKLCSCCWDSRSYFSVVQTSLLHDERFSYRPLSRITVVSMLSAAISDMEIWRWEGWGLRIGVGGWKL